MEQTCQKCGALNAENASTCTNCGSQLPGVSFGKIVGYQLKDNYGQSYSLLGLSIQIGSGKTRSICLDEPNINDLEAELTWEGQTWVICNQAESDNVLVNDQLLKGKKTLQEGDTIRIGSTIFRYSAVYDSMKMEASAVAQSGTRSDDFSAFRSTGETSVATSSTVVPPSPPAAQKICSTCGKTIYAAAEICPYCGVRQMTIPITPAKTGKHNRITAALLAIFLGGLGFHKFYLGSVGMGIIYLLFCWTFIPEIIGFIEGIIYLTMSDQSFVEKYG